MWRGMEGGSGGGSGSEEEDAAAATRLIRLTAALGTAAAASTRPVRAEVGADAVALPAFTRGFTPAFFALPLDVAPTATAPFIDRAAAAVDEICVRVAEDATEAAEDALCCLRAAVLECVEDAGG